ncbi:MAG: hypothetical protein ACREQK_12280, partial [Candidatus Binatia bacterium]
MAENLSHAHGIRFAAVSVSAFYYMASAGKQTTRRPLQRYHPEDRHLWQITPVRDLLLFLAGAF